MKIILPVLVIGILVLSGLGAGALNNIKENTNKNTNIKNSDRATHTVLGEDGTATWCPYCVFAGGALKALYAQGNLDFYYVSLVTDKNSKANARANDYNLVYLPTVYWDGGYRVDIGAGSIPSAEATYTASINACGNRAVKDVDIQLTATWLGDTKMKFDVTVTNNEADTYGGTLRVYITEKVSSMGWKDHSGILYEFPFLDWAFNEPISIDAGGSFSDSVTWNGASHGFTTITMDNLKIIGAVFNDEKHQGYSDPPTGSPFNAYYVDKVVATEPVIGNNPPVKPVITGQTNVKVGVSNQYTFVSTDPDGNNVAYYIDWGDGQTTPWTNFQASGTQYSESHMWSTKGTYTIKAKAKDTNGAESDYTTMSITVAPKVRTKIELNPLLTDLLQRLPVLNKLVENLFKY